MSRWLSTVSAGAILMLGSTMIAHAQNAASAEKDAILILDASGSMWGQIDGVNKIVIAKDVVESLVQGLPESQRIGMVAYGHRRKGDCSDIETIADVGADREAVIKQIRNLSPKGKTPLTKSVEHAANELDYTVNAASVILVSDGLETCDADPCALARLLEEKGLDFTVHVVGFDVTEDEREGLVCIAEETGGEFLPADNADELADALSQVAMSEPEPQPAETVPAPVPIGFYATILKGGPQIQRDVNWTITNVETGEVVHQQDRAGRIGIDMVPGDYTAEAVWTGWPHKGERVAGDKVGTKDFTIKAAPSVIVVPIDLGLPLTFETDAEIIEGHPVNVSWSGPDDLSAYITTNSLDDGPRDSIYSFATQRARNSYQKEAEKSGTAIDTNGDSNFDQDDLAKSQVGGPSVPGEYEVRYTLANPRVILARRSLTVVDNPHTLSAPETVPVSTEFEITWTGEKSRDGDFLVLVTRSENGSATAVTPRVRLTEGETATMLSAPEPGEYEIQYVLDNGYTTYEGMDNAVQETIPITVTAVSAEIEAPANVVGGSNVSIEIDAPDGWEDDTVSVVEPEATQTNSDSRFALGRIQQDDGSFEIRVPARAGEYEIAYFINPGSKVIARKPLTITQAEASVDAPSSVKIGEAFTISYTGAAFRGDRIIIAPADVEDNAMWGWGTRYGFAATSDATSGTINERRSSDILKTPGDYTVRYVSGLQHITLARDTMTVVE